MMWYHPLALPKVKEKMNIPAVEEQIKMLQHIQDEALASHKLAR